MTLPDSPEDPLPASARLATSSTIVARIRLEHRRISERFDRLAGTTKCSERPPLFEDLEREILSYTQAKTESVYPALVESALPPSITEPSQKQCSELLRCVRESSASTTTNPVGFHGVIDHLAWLFQEHVMREETVVFPAVAALLDEAALADLDTQFRLNKRRWLTPLQAPANDEALPLDTASGYEST